MHAVSQTKLIKAFIESHLHPMGSKGKLCYSFNPARPVSVFVHYCQEVEEELLEEFALVPNMCRLFPATVGGQRSLEVFFSPRRTSEAVKYLEEFQTCPIMYDKLTFSQLFSAWGVVYPDPPHMEQGTPCGELRYFTQESNSKGSTKMYTHLEILAELDRRMPQC